MSIKKISVQHLQIPFNDSFCHASAERHRGDSLIVSVVLEDGTVGYGEGCPRSYVTGENCRDAAEFVHQISRSIRSNVHDTKTLGDWIKSNERLIDSNPAAWCGLELAIIDALAKNCSVTAASLLDFQPKVDHCFKYTAVIGGGSIKNLARYMRAYNSFQFDDFKIKLTGELDLDSSRINQFEKQGSGCRLRLDANNLWSKPTVAANYLRQLPDVFFAIEEPLAAKDFSGLKSLAKLIDQKIILDESFTSMKDFDFIPDGKDRFILNIRVSKLGGLIRSKMITEMAEDLGIYYIIGAHVGETSILTRAAMMLGCSTGNRLVAREGAAGEFLLTKDICKHSIMFGPEGLYQDRNDTFGIGYEVNLDELSRYGQLESGDALPVNEVKR